MKLSKKSRDNLKAAERIEVYQIDHPEGGVFMMVSSGGRCAVLHTTAGIAIWEDEDAARAFAAGLRPTPRNA